MPHRFVVITDTHFIAPGHRMVGRTWWNRVLEAQLEQICAALREAMERVQPDFIVHCGDFTGHCDAVNWAYGVEAMDRLGSPWYVAPGNHDTWFPGVRAALATRAGSPGDHCYFARDLAGLRFIFLDVVYWTTADGEATPYVDNELFERGLVKGIGPSRAELAWLEAELAAADRPVVLVSHAPLGYRSAYPMPTLPYGTPATAPETSVAALMGDVLQRDTMRALMRRHPRVKLAFAGHWHLADMVREDGVAFCQTGSLREFPFEFRVVEVDGETARVSTQGLGEAFQRASYIEAWNNRWIAGTEATRTFSVNLRD